MNLKDMSEESWELAEACLDILPRDNLAVSGLTLIQLLTVWLAAVPEEQRVQSYLQWLEMLHRHLTQNGVMFVTEVDVPAVEPSGMVH
jgi:hypothetical protein